jgi:hypothetical protein
MGSCPDPHPVAVVDHEEVVFHPTAAIPKPTLDPRQTPLVDLADHKRTLARHQTPIEVAS